MGKNAMERILFIDMMLRKEGYPKKKYISEHFEVSTKTIERDIEYMKYRLGAPITYNRVRGGYEYEEIGYFLPSFHVGQDEALALFISHYLGNAWKGTPLASTAEKLWNQFSSMIGEDIIMDVSLFNETVFLVDQSVEINTSIWLNVFVAARSKHKIAITFRTAGYDTSLTRVIHPYRLIHHKNNWYVLSFDESSKKVYTYSISRIEKVVEQKETFSLPPNFDAKDYIDPYFGLATGGESYTVVLLTNKKLVTVLSEHIPSQNSTIENTGDENVLISFTTTQKDELLYWLLQWGSNIEVIEPMWVKEKLYKIGEYFITRYKD